MATESFNKKFVLSSKYDIKRFNSAFSTKKNIKIDSKKFAYPDNDEKVQEQLKLLFSR